MGFGWGWNGMEWNGNERDAGLVWVCDENEVNDVELGWK